LLKLREEWHKIPDIMPTMVFYKDKENRYIYANKAFTQILGLAKKDLEGKSSFEIFPKQAQACWRHDKIVLESQKPIRSIIEFLETPSGKKWILTDKLPIMDENGHVDGILGFSIDITEQKMAEKALRESKRELQKQKKALEQKNIALHELIEQIEKEKNMIRDNITINVSELALPILAKLKMNVSVRKYANLLETLLKEITSSFGSRIIEKNFMLTPREIEICNMIKNGLGNKEISGLLNISSLTVETHRRSIRHKVGISNKHINLATFLCKF
jgi:PAS domain S-box-containing protein